MKYLFLIIIILSACTKRSGEESVVAICSEESFFTKKCRYVEKALFSKSVDFVSLSQSDKPARDRNAFIKFDFFTKISFNEAKERAVKMCQEAMRDLDYFEVTYTETIGIRTKGQVDIWCTLAK